MQVGLARWKDGKAVELVYNEQVPLAECSFEKLEVPVPFSHDVTYRAYYFSTKEAVAADFSANAR